MNDVFNEERFSKSPVLLEVVGGSPPFISRWAFVIFGIIAGGLLLGAQLIKSSSRIKTNLKIAGDGVTYSVFATIDKTDANKIHTGQEVYIQVGEHPLLKGLVLSGDSIIVRIKLYNYNKEEEEMKPLEGLIITSNTRLLSSILYSLKRNKFN